MMAFHRTKICQRLKAVRGDQLVSGSIMLDAAFETYAADRVESTGLELGDRMIHFGIARQLLKNN